MTDTRVYSVNAREILDSRGNPTVETTAILGSGYRGTASVPAGASLGKYEAVELRDNDPSRFGGLGVLKAVGNVNAGIQAALKGKDAADQSAIDTILKELDATPDKARLGANAILSASLACAAAAATAQRLPLYRYLNTLFNTLYKTPLARIPTPTFNLINGGKHGAGNLNIQEFQVVPATNKPYHVGLQMVVELYHLLKKELVHRNAITSIGDEGGYAPNLFTNLDAVEIIVDVIHQTSYKLGVDIFLGLDVAGGQFKTDRGYQLIDRANPYSAKELIEYLKDLHKKYRLLLLEDPLDEDDWESWKELTAVLGREVIIIGDDLLATNPERLTRSMTEKACNGILLKPNQIGTLSEFLTVCKMAKEHGVACVVSHRSGETNDAFIADLAVAVQSEYVKFGAPARGERVEKYNRLLQIESELLHQ